MRRHQHQQQGIALMLVMWVLTLLTIMAVSLTAVQRTQTTLAGNHVDGARFRMLAEAAIAYTALDFMTQSSQLDDDAEAPPQWVPDGTPRWWNFAGTELELRVSNELSRISLNQATPTLLADLLVLLEVPDDEAAALADAIADWSDNDDLALINGAEDPDYDQAGRALGAKDEPFISVEELRQVLGMTPEIYQRLAPHVTVEGAGGGLDESFASAIVLAASRGVPLEDAEREVAERNEGMLPDGSGPLVVGRGGPLYRLQVSTGGLGGGRRQMEAVFELSPGLEPPYRVLWRRFDGTADETQAVDSDTQDAVLD